jgi:hypothetical protein
MRKGRPKVALILTAEERQRLESFAHRSRSAAALARRARITLACAEGTVGQLIVELDVGVLQPERAHEVRHRFSGNLPPGAPGVMNVDRGDLARQLRRLGQQAKLRRGNPTDRPWH